MIPDNQNPDFVTDPEDRDTPLNDNSNETVDSENLNYDETTNSYEYDVKGDNPDYDHPDPYDTAVKDGEDMNSTYDEANPYDTNGEYDENRIFGRMLIVPLKPSVRGDDGHSGGREDDRLAEAGEQIGGDHSLEQGTGMRRSANQRDACGHQQGNGQPADHPRAAAARECREHHQHQAADGEDDFGQQRSKPDH